ncbi:TPA: hypothetical protein L0163_000305 [Citrobacter freundii]|uniref:hypothetical protein n=2 Tax=Citrobacter freundii TaxID=546 RepID=UPI00044DC0C4|nr:hypothetical protein [Citrobacter freundii]ELK7202430.1 hypothetical protein [Citrobacter freundii]EXF29070.1 hypothetical protein V172_18450 [Citrobacter freundii RLS1]MBJ8945005.1 hypothetical protein [Citrobacter freundii]MBS6109535.1 hypothetical protein [Citrobacter freundii]MBX8901435.1 hypothetical protein [Citrobacter freundii]
MLVIQIFDVVFFLIILITLLLSGLKRDTTLFFVLLTCLYGYYDWIYLLAKDYVNHSIVLISGYAKEIAVYLLCMIYMGRLFLNHNKYQQVLLTLSILIVISVLGIMNNGLSNYFIGFNSYVPMLLLLIAICQTDAFVNKKNYINACFILIVLPNAIFALYQYYNYHMIKDFWFYDSFMNMDLALNEWDYFREGFVRPFGFFSNTLSLAFFCFFIFVGSSVYSKNSKILVMLISLIPALLSGTRTIFLVAVLFFCLLFLYKIRMHYKLKTYSYILLVLIGFIGTLFIIVNLSGDLSSLGRVTQWTDVLTDLKSNPLGHGVGFAGVGLEKWPDSNVIAYIYMAGYIGLVIALYFLIKISAVLSKDGNQSYIFLLLILYVALFQNVSAVIMLPIIAMSVKSRVDNIERCK